MNRDIYEKCKAIMAWAEEKEDFDTDFVLNVMVFFETGKPLTPAMVVGIENIITSFNIDTEKWLET